MEDWMWAWANSEINAYVLLEQAFPETQEADKFIMKNVIEPLPHNDDVRDLLSRVSSIWIISVLYLRFY
jgi:hypothetical protein